MRISPCAVILWVAITLFGTSTAHGINQEIYLAIRSGGEPGTGTKEDPFDCGGATDAIKAGKYDTIINNCRAAGGNWHVILGEGTFMTNGGNGNTNTGTGCIYPSNMTVSGQGRTATIIKLADKPPHWGTENSKWGVIAPRPTTTAGQLVVQHLTVDGNWPGIYARYGAAIGLNKAILCLGFFGSNNEAYDCRFINMYGHAEENLECFTILCRCTAGTESGTVTFLNPTNNHIRNCLFELPQGNYHACILFSGSSPSNRMSNWSVKDCQAYGDPTTTAGVKSFATGLVNMAYVEGGVVEGNYTVDCAGVYNDTGDVHDLWVRNNTFKRIRRAGTMISNNGAGMTFTNIHFDDNYYEVHNRGNGTLHTYGAALGGSASFSGCSISRNTFVKNPSGPDAQKYRAIYMSGTHSNEVVIDNIGDSSMEWTTDTDNTLRRGNRDFNGNMIGYAQGRDNDGIKYVAAQSGTVNLNPGTHTVILTASALTGNLGIKPPRADHFASTGRVTVFDPKGIVGTYKVQWVPPPNGTLNGASVSLDALNTPYSDSTIVTNGVSDVHTMQGLVSANLVAIPDPSAVRFVATGKTKTYDNKAMAGQGLSAIYASVASAGQTASISSTNLQVGGAIAPAGLYRVTYYTVATTAGTSGTLDVTIGWKDGTASRTETQTAALTFGTASYATKTVIVRANGIDHITYSTTLNSPVGRPAYALYATLERLQ